LVTGVSGKPIGEVLKDPETSATDLQPKTRNITKDWRSHLLWDERLK